MPDTKPPVSATTLLDLYSLMAACIESGWCWGWFAKDDLGRDVESNDLSAVRFCILGAIHGAVAMWLGRSKESLEVAQWLEEALKRLPNRSLEDRTLEDWNDAPQRRRRDVLRLISRAAAALSSK